MAAATDMPGASPTPARTRALRAAVRREQWQTAFCVQTSVGRRRRGGGWQGGGCRATGTVPSGSLCPLRRAEVSRGQRHDHFSGQSLPTPQLALPSAHPAAKSRASGPGARAGTDRGRGSEHPRGMPRLQWARQARSLAGPGAPPGIVVAKGLVELIVNKSTARAQTRGAYVPPVHCQAKEPHCPRIPAQGLAETATYGCLAWPCGSTADGPGVGSAGGCDPAPTRPASRNKAPPGPIATHSTGKRQEGIFLWFGIAVGRRGSRGSGVGLKNR